MQLPVYEQLFQTEVHGEASYVTSTILEEMNVKIYKHYKF